MEMLVRRFVDMGVQRRRPTTDGLWAAPHDRLRSIDVADAAVPRHRHRLQAVDRHDAGGRRRRRHRHREPLSRAGSATSRSCSGWAPTSAPTATTPSCAGVPRLSGAPVRPPTSGPARRSWSPAWPPTARPWSAASTTSTAATTTSSVELRGASAPTSSRRRLTGRGRPVRSRPVGAARRSRRSARRARAGSRPSRPGGRARRAAGMALHRHEELIGQVDVRWHRRSLHCVKRPEESTRCVTQVEETIEVIRPALQADGGDIVLRDVDEETGVVTVELVGACGTCPASHRDAEGRHRADHARPRRRRHRGRQRRDVDVVRGSSTTARACRGARSTARRDGDRARARPAAVAVERGWRPAPRGRPARRTRCGGSAYTVGLTGAPGAGKSHADQRPRSATCGRRATRSPCWPIDPSSPFTGGAILGDRVRMQDHATRPRRVHPLDGDPRPPRRAVAGDAARRSGVLDAVGRRGC